MLYLPRALMLAFAIAGTSYHFEKAKATSANELITRSYSCFGLLQAIRALHCGFIVFIPCRKVFYRIYSTQRPQRMPFRQKCLALGYSVSLQGLCRLGSAYQDCKLV